MKQSASSHHPRLQIDHWYSNVAQVSEVLWVRQTTVTPGTKSLHARRTAANEKRGQHCTYPGAEGASRSCTLRVPPSSVAATRTLHLCLLSGRRHRARGRLTDLSAQLTAGCPCQLPAPAADCWLASGLRPLTRATDHQKHHPLPFEEPSVAPHSVRLFALPKNHLGLLP